jgi:DHA2 family multidrug resistance protein
MTLPIGWLAGRFGRKKVFLTAIAGFTVSSALCGFSSSIGEMVVFRLMQGAFGAALVPVSQAVLLDTYPKEKHGAAMAVWGVGIMVGPILGPTLGGYLTEYYNWRWVFYINLPVGILSMIGVSTFLHETKRHDRPFDMPGFLTLSLAIGAIQLILDRGEQVDWFNSIELVIYGGIVIGMVWMFLVHSRYARHPFLSAEIFRDRNFVTALVFIFFISIILMSTLALLPPFMQTLMGYPVMTAGMLMAPRGIGTMIAMIIVGKTSGKIDSRPLILFGLILTATSLWQMSRFNSFVPAHLIVQSGLIQGFGLGFVSVPTSVIAFRTLQAEHRTEAAGLYSLLRNIGSSVGISVVTVMLSQSTQINHSYLAENITPFNTGLAQHYMLQAAGRGVTAPLAVLNGEITRQAATIGYNNDFSIMMWVVILVMPLVFLLRNPLHRTDEELPELIPE